MSDRYKSCKTGHRVWSGTDKPDLTGLGKRNGGAHRINNITLAGGKSIVVRGPQILTNESNPEVPPDVEARRRPPGFRAPDDVITPCAKPKRRHDLVPLKGW